MSARLRIAVTGANGYVGSVIVESLKEDATVLGLVRSPSGAGQVRWSFDSDPDPVERALRNEGITTLVHAAWDMRASSREELEIICVAGSRTLLAAARQAGVERLVFISSISAFDAARSAYGRSKLKVEQAFRQAKGVVLRLGLVYGERPGGVFASIDKVARTAALIPLIGDGSAPQYLLDERTLCNVVRRAARGEFDGDDQAITVAHPEPIAFRDLLLRIASAEKRRPILAPVPWRILYSALWSAEKLGLSLNVRSDSVLSFVYQNPSPDFRAMARYAIRPVAFSAGFPG